MQEQQMIEDGEEYLVINCSCRGQIFKVELTDHVEVNDDVLKLQ